MTVGVGRTIWSLFHNLTTREYGMLKWKWVLGQILADVLILIHEHEKQM